MIPAFLLLYSLSQLVFKHRMVQRILAIVAMLLLFAIIVAFLRLQLSELFSQL